MVFIFSFVSVSIGYVKHSKTGKSRFPGLHIWTAQGKKLLVKVRDGCLLVQAGKQFEWLTGGHVKAGFHEVVVVPETLTVCYCCLPYTHLVGHAFCFPFSHVCNVQDMDRQRQQGRPLWRISSTLFSHIASDQVLQPLGKFKASPFVANYPQIQAGKQVEEELKFISLSSS